jgi:hypothetical protein
LLVGGRIDLQEHLVFRDLGIKVGANFDDVAGYLAADGDLGGRLECAGGTNALHNASLAHFNGRIFRLFFGPSEEIVSGAARGSEDDDYDKNDTTVAF